MAKPLLQLEGAVVMLACGTIAFFHLGLSWWWLPVFIVGPDISMLGYLANPRVGAALYNIAHTYAIAVPVLCAGVLLDHSGVLTAGLILTAHIGMDRTLGYGLKYPSAFKDTHFRRLADS